MVFSYATDSLEYENDCEIDELIVMRFVLNFNLINDQANEFCALPIWGYSEVKHKHNFYRCKAYLHSPCGPYCPPVLSATVPSLS